jgi:hypothetical protein
MLAAGALAGLVLTFVARKLIGMVIYFEAQKEAGGFLAAGAAAGGCGLAGRADSRSPRRIH